MGVLLMLEQNKRRAPRFETKVNGFASLGTYSGVCVTVRDASDGGVFLEPGVGYVDGAFTDSNDLDVIAGDFLDLEIEGVHRRLEVRWTGRSARHGTKGWGCMFAQSYGVRAA